MTEKNQSLKPSLALGYVSKGPERKVNLRLKDPHTTTVFLQGYDHEVAQTLIDLGIVQTKSAAEDVFTQRVPLPHWEGK